MMIKNLFKKPLFWIFVIALFFRVYKLGDLPSGFHADEVRVGWNALSILKTGKDDWGESFPLHYNTFGDFRPTGYFYITIPSLLIFGSNEFAVRFPGALFGALSVIVLFYLTDKITKNKNIALFSSLLLALSPWHISLSRATSEGIVAIFLVLLGFYFLLRKKLLFAFLFLSSSYLFYHSARLLVPVLTTTIIFYLWRNQLVKLTKPVTFLVSSLFILTFLFGMDREARGRFTQVSIFHDLDVKYELTKMPFEEGPNKVFIARLFHNKVAVYTRRFINEYTQYLSSKFLLVPKEAKPARYSTVGMGVLTYVEFALLALGVIAIVRGKAGALPLALLLLAPLPAALTTEDSPNMHRAAFMIPFIAIAGGIGLGYLNRYKIIIFAFLLLNFSFFVHMYFVHNPVHLPLYRNVGAKELALKLKDLDDKYDKIVVTNIPDSPYPWIAFFTNQKPDEFNKAAEKRDQGTWTYKNYIFTGLRCPSRDAFKEDVKRLLVLDAEACESEAAQYNYGEDVIILDQIKRPDRTIVYTLWSRTPKE